MIYGYAAVLLGRNVLYPRSRCAGRSLSYCWCVRSNRDALSTAQARYGIWFAFPVPGYRAVSHGVRYAASLTVTEREP